jgi:WS/DGAT/MGAT family acyltransferase
VKNALGGTVNDVVLATAAGAIGRFLRRHGADPRAIDYRAVVPVSVRVPEERGALSNRASAWLTSLPVGERDPQRRLAKVRAQTAELKATNQELGPWALLKVADWAAPVLVSLGIRLTERLHPYNLIVTNIPGPQLPLYLLGSPMLAGYPLVPLFQNQGLGVAVFSYLGKLCVGINADRDQVVDLHDLVGCMETSFGELRAVAALAAARRTEPSRRASG